MRITLFSGIATMALLLIALTVWSVAEEGRARRGMEQAAQTNRILSLVLTDLLNGETGVRGFVLTQDRAYLAPYDAGMAEIGGLLDQLDGLMQAAPDRAGLMTGLRATVARKQKIMARTLELNASAGREAAIAFVATREGLRTMDRARAEIATLQGAIDSALAADLRRLRGLLWWKNLGLIGLTLATVAALLMTGGMIRRAAAAEMEAEQALRVRAERDRADLVSRELSHRVKNLFAVIMSIISTTGRTESDPKEAARKTRERVQALARAHALSTGQRELRETQLRALVEAVVGPYAPAPSRLICNGPDVVLASSTVTPLGLIINELATNALKYGCWSGTEGTLRVDWSLQKGDDDDKDLRLDWTETATSFTIPQAGAGRGFGTTMIDLSAQQANATVERRMTETGLTVTLTLKEAGPPPQTTVEQ